MKAFARPVARAKILGPRLLSPGNTLSRRVIHAGFWVFSLRIADRLFGLARTVILARLLSPEDFGLFGIAMLMLSILETFSQTGFQAALVQKKDNIKPYLDTAWTIQVLRGFALTAILAATPTIAVEFFNEPRVAMLLQILALSELFRGFTNISVIFFQKEFEFHKWFFYMFSSTIADLGVAIPAAFILRNAWALILGVLSGSLVQLLVSYIICPYRPRLRLEMTKVKELSTFGWWVFGQTIVAFLATQGPGFFLAKMSNATALGLFQMASRFCNVIIPEITNASSKVLFPTYSKLQNDVVKLKQVFLDTLEILIALSLIHI